LLSTLGMHPKRKLRLTRQTIANLTGEQLDRVAGGWPTTIIIIGDSPKPPPPPRTNSIAPCCASNDGPCPTE
jgi:hypothetical protein